MHDYTFRAYFPDAEKTVEISKISGAAGSMNFHVYMDKYYILGIHKSMYGEWHWHTHDNSVLTGDDIFVLIEIIEREFPDDREYPQRPEEFDHPG